MKPLTATLLSLPLLGMAQASPKGAPADAGVSPAASGGGAPALTITRSGSQPSAKGPAENFTGTVRVDPLFTANAPARTSGASVTFEPGARPSRTA